MTNQPLTIEHEYNASPELIWRALTETDLMKNWYFDIANFKPEVGYKFQFEGGEEDRRYVHLCEVLEVIPQKRLKYSWEYEGEEGRSMVTFELSTLMDKTKVQLTHENLDSFTNPIFSRAKFKEGWQYLLNKSLDEFLKNGKALRYW